MPGVTEALHAMRTRGIDNAEELLTFATPDEIVATCAWWDARKAERRDVHAGLLASKIRAGGIEPGAVPEPAEDRKQALADWVHEHYPIGAVVEPHQLMARRCNHVDVKCGGDMVVLWTDGIYAEVQNPDDKAVIDIVRVDRPDWPILNCQCSQCEFVAAYSPRAMRDIGQTVPGIRRR